MTRIEASRLGGQALAAKVCTGYFRFIGRRGGRRTQYLYWLDVATEQEDPEMREHYLEKAERWRDEVGNYVMLELWSKEYQREKFARRRRRPIGEKELRAWERSIVKP